MDELKDMSHAEFILWSRYHMRRKQEKELQQKMAGGG